MLSSGLSSGPTVPTAFRRRVLLAVTGLTPQVITESVYALACTGPSAERFIPTEVQVLTTQIGAEVIDRVLLAGSPGGFERLCREHHLPPMEFGPDQVHVVGTAEGLPLTDVRTAADNACLADAITERVRTLTADPGCALHVSLAGGRKTMGFYAGYALSLFGRVQDRLSHVLVSPPFESAPDFLYPTVQSHPVHVKPGGAIADASRARVELAEIPFVRLRDGLPRALLQGSSSFAAVVQAAAGAHARPRLTVDLAQRLFVADGRALSLPPQSFSLYAALVSRALAGKPALAAPPREVHSAEWAEELLADLARLVGVMQVDSAFEESLRADCSGQKVSPMVSRLRAALRDQLAPGRDALYFDDGGRHRGKRYRVPLATQQIEVIAGRGP